MKRKKRLNTRDVQEMDRMYRAGTSLRGIAKKYNLSTTQTWKRLKLFGTPLRNPARHDPAREAEMVLLHSRGLTYAAIGRQFGISRQRVHQILNGKDN